MDCEIGSGDGAKWGDIGRNGAGWGWMGWMGRGHGGGG